MRLQVKRTIVADSRNTAGQCYYRVIQYTNVRGRWFRIGESSPIPRYLYLTDPKLRSLPWGHLDGKPVE